MNIRQFVIFGVVIGFLLQSCGKIPETNYFSDHDHIIKPTPTKLSGTKLIDNLIGASKIEIVDSLIALISPRNEKMISVYDLSGNFIADFGTKGQGPNDLQNCSPVGQKGTVNNESYIWVNDVSSLSLKKLNLSRSISNQQLVVEDISPTYPMSLNAFRINDSITVCESMTEDNYSLIRYNYIRKRRQSREDIYLKPNSEPFSFYKSIWRINDAHNIIVGAMLSINQLNLWNLDTDERKSVIIEKPYLPDQVIDIDGLENRTFFCDLEVSNDLVFALYMDQDYDISYEQPKEMTVFIFDWKLNLI